MSKFKVEMKKTLFFYLFILWFGLSIQAQTDLIIPKPFSVVNTAGSFTINNQTTLKYVMPADELYLTLLAEHLQLNGGIRLKKDSLARNNFITLKRIKGEYPFGWYLLEITKENVTITAADHEGALNAVSTLLQLLNMNQAKGLELPCVKIEDKPRFGWRGMHLDESRHFFGKAFVKKYLDVMFQYHMNVFHWHLTDDQGWRIEIKSYPELTRKGAWRKGSMIGAYNDQKFDTLQYGGFYTQEDIKEIVDYAFQRGITVVPEIEMPGHSQAAVASYPWLSCKRVKTEVAKGWGVFENVLCTHDSVFMFLEGVISEVSQLFPGEYIHIGGDECPKIAWKACNVCQQKIKDENLKDEHELQSYFIKRVEWIVNRYGKKIIGWDEILEGGLAPNAAVMSWRGVSGGIAAAKMGHRVVMTPGTHCYFDHYQGQPQDEPLAIGGFTPLDKVYKYEPIPDSLNESEQKYIMGAQANLWTEYINTPSQAQYMVLPRMLALSEVLWTQKSQKSESNFFKRLPYHLQHLEKSGYSVSKSYLQPTSTVVNLNGMPTLFLTKGAFEGKIVYTSDNSNPDIHSPSYNDPIIIKKSCVIKFATLVNGKIQGKVISRSFYFSKSTAKTVTFKTAPSKYYNAGGAFTLVNGVRAQLPRVNNEWLGWSGDTLVATVDLGERTTIRKVEIGFLKEEHNWIYLPTAMLIEVSVDGKSFTPISSASRQQIQEQKRFVKCEFNDRSIRYVRITAYPSGKIPSGSPGAGENSWLFCDEIIIE